MYSKTIKKNAYVKSIRRLALSVLCFMVVLGCCSWVTADEPEVPFWIVTEKTPDSGMNGVVRDAIEAFSAIYPKVSIHLEILPTGTEARTQRIQELHELMAKGGGPDVFLLPSDFSINTGTQYRVIDPFFSNVPYAMREGTFLDISEYYDGDTGLEKQALQQAVVDAGCVGEQRFLLPLSFDMNIFYFLYSNAEEGSIGLQADMTAMDIMEYGIRSGDSLLAWTLTDLSSARYRPEMVFSSLIDYDTGNVTLSFEEVERFFGVYQKLSSIAKASDGVSLYPTIWEYVKTSASERSLLPCYLSGLSRAVAFPAIAALEGEKLRAIPLRAVNGEVSAMVSYFGAVSANTSYPRLAYEFLRTLLQPEYQWRVGVTGDLILEDWPVRVGGSVEAVWPEICSRITSQRVRQILESLNATDEWVTQITDQITRVDFRADLNLANALNQLAKGE